MGPQFVLLTTVWLITIAKVYGVKYICSGVLVSVD